MESAPDLEGFVKRLEGIENRALSAPRASAPETRPAPVQAAAPAPAQVLPDGAVWKKLLDNLEKNNPILHNFFAGCAPDFSDKNSWRLEFADDFGAKAAERKAAALEELIFGIVHRRVKLLFAVSAKKTAPAAEAAPEETSISDEEPLAQGEVNWQDLPSAPEPAENPAVKKILKIIPGKVLPANEKP